MNPQPSSHRGPAAKRPRMESSPEGQVATSPTSHYSRFEVVSVHSLEEIYATTPSSNRNARGMELRVQRLRTGRRQRCKDGRLSLLKAALLRNAKERRQREGPGCEEVEEDEEVEEVDEDDEDEEVEEDEEVAEEGEAGEVAEEGKEAAEGANLKEGEEHEEGCGESYEKAKAYPNSSKPATVVGTSLPTSEAQCSPPVAENGEDLDELAMLTEDQYVYEWNEMIDNQDVYECDEMDDNQDVYEWDILTVDEYGCEWDPMVSTLLQATPVEEHDHTPTSPTEGMSLNEMDTWSDFDDVLIDL